MIKMNDLNFWKDSIYIGTCAQNLEGMLKKSDLDKNHYRENDVTNELKEWYETKRKFFVIGSSLEERRRPLLWKEEYSTQSGQKGEFIALSWYVMLFKMNAKFNLANAISSLMANPKRKHKKGSKWPVKRQQENTFSVLYITMKLKISIILIYVGIKQKVKWLWLLHQNRAYRLCTQNIEFHKRFFVNLIHNKKLEE